MKFLKKKRVKIPLLILLGLLLIFVLSFIPTLWLKSPNMSLLEGKWINVCYQSENESAEDVFNLLESESEALLGKLGFSEKQDVTVYIYDSQYEMQTKKYGLIVPLFGLDWYIGDNIGTNVILTSPANPGKVHDYDNNKYASVHELVHAYVSVLNPKIDLWLTEGMALYLSNGQPFNKEKAESFSIPSYELTKTSNPIEFADEFGYDYAHVYIEYLDKTYGWDKVLELIKTENYQEVFGKDSKAIYGEWVLYIKNYSA